jgi:carboxyl-terminal processing protease
MRWKNFLIAGFLGGTFLWMGPALTAQPAPAPPPPPAQITTHPRLGGSVYAQNILYTIELIEENYVRPVAQVELVVAALQALHEAAGERAPTSLRADAERAIKNKETLRLLEQTRKLPPIQKRLTDSEALLTSCRAMMQALDPFCAVLMGEEARRMGGQMDNFGTGIDLEDHGATGPVRIKEIMPGSPAQKAGLRPGDRITAIDGKSLANLTPFQSMQLLQRGEQPGGKNYALESDVTNLTLPPSKVRVTFERHGEARPRDIMLERREFQTETVFGVRRHDDNSWDFWIDRERKIAQVRIGPIRDSTDGELREALADLRAHGMRGLLLDLRWCPGGLIEQSVYSAELFLGAVRIAAVKGRTADESSRMDSREPGPFLDVPILVLVNSETSGGGELIAAALQDHHRAIIAGQRTRGKASVQSMHVLPPIKGSYLKITTGLFLRPNGKNLHRFPESKSFDDWGVRPGPGLEFRVSPAHQRQLRDWWAAQTLRPGGSRERLPLDDPDADPQRQLALQTLRERLK